jgi:hypothetical protein
MPSPGSQVGEPFGEEPPGVWGSLDGHLPWETALREPSRLVQTGSRPTSHRGGHWFDPSIAHPAQRPVAILRLAVFDPPAAANGSNVLEPVAELAKLERGRTQIGQRSGASDVSALTSRRTSLPLTSWNCSPRRAQPHQGRPDPRPSRGLHLRAGRGRGPGRRRRKALHGQARSIRGTTARHQRSRPGACGAVEARGALSS